jgi:hypothetical protein
MTSDLTRRTLPPSILTRRTFLTAASGAAASLAIPGQRAFALPAASGQSPLRGRFLTHVSIVRVNQIEVTPTTFATAAKPSPQAGPAAR